MQSLGLWRRIDLLRHYPPLLLDIYLGTPFFAQYFANPGGKLEVCFGLGGVRFPFFPLLFPFGAIITPSVMPALEKVVETPTAVRISTLSLGWGGVWGDTP